MTNILFDLDGTLTDPREGITRCIQYALETMNLPVPAQEELLWCIGPPLVYSFGKLFNSQNEAPIQRALALYRERFEKTGMYENVVYPEIPATLATLKDAGHRLFVATAKPRVFARGIIAHFELDPFFDEVYGSELDGRLTDKGELIAHLLATEEIAAHETIMVGDREMDITEAHANRIRAIGVEYGYGGREELTRARADSLCETPAEIPDAAAELLG